MQRAHTCQAVPRSDVRLGGRSIAQHTSLPVCIKILTKWLARKIADKPMRICRDRRASLGEAFRVDAKAEDGMVVIGGWECYGNVSPSRARCSSVRLNKGNAAWTFARGEPYRSISALELMATLVALKAFGKGASWAGGDCSYGLTAFTDNQSCGHVSDKLITTQYPFTSS